MTQFPDWPSTNWYCHGVTRILFCLSYLNIIVTEALGVVESFINLILSEAKASDPPPSIPAKVLHNFADSVVKFRERSHFAPSRCSRSWEDKHGGFVPRGLMLDSKYLL